MEDKFQARTIVWLSGFGFCAALRTELRSRFEFSAAFFTENYLLDLCAAFRAKLDFLNQRFSAFGAGCPGSLAPTRLFEHFTVILSHPGMCPNFLDRPAGLRCCHLDSQVGRAILAETLTRVPAFFPAYPGGATRALDKISLNLRHSFDERLVVILFPVAVRALSPIVEAWLKMPPKRLLAVSRAPLILPMV